MKLTLHQLRILRVVAEEGSITSAARRLHLTPPTLSIQLGQLSEALGLPLYQVSSRKLRLTEAGHDALEAARRIDAELKRLEQRLSARRGIERGRLRIAAVSTAEYLLPGLLGQFQDAHPGIEASLTILPRNRLLERMSEGVDDGYLMTRPPQKGDLTIETVGLNPLVMIAAPSHPWAKRAKIDFSALAAQRFVVRETGSGTRLWTADWLAHFGADLQPSLELGSNEAIKQAVMAGYGLAIISLHAVKLELQARRLVLLRVPHFPAPVRWSLIQRTEAATPAALAFRAHLLEQMPARDAEIIALLKQHGLALPRAGRNALDESRGTG